MTWQYLRTTDDGGLREVTVYKNRAEVGTFQNGAHPDVSSSEADFHAFSIDKIKDLMHSQASTQRQLAAEAYANNNTDDMLGHINNWMAIVEDAAFEQIVEVENPP